MSKILDINTWLNFLFVTQGHKKLNQITTIKRYWKKTGEDRAPLDSFWKDPKYWGPGETLADQHSYEMHRVLDIEAVVPGVKLGKVDLGYFAFEDIFELLREYVQIIKDEYTKKEWAGCHGWEENHYRIVKIDFGEFQVYAREQLEIYNKSLEDEIKHWTRGQCIFMTVPRININYKPSEKDTAVKTENRLYFIGAGDTAGGYYNYGKNYRIYLAPTLNYPTQAKDFFVYMQKNFKIFGEKIALNTIGVWNKSRIGEQYAFPTYNITNEADIKYYLNLCKKDRLLEKYYKLPEGISINYDIDTFVTKLSITQEQVNDYIKLISSKQSPIEIITEV
jgi:hypothetical protein